MHNWIEQFHILHWLLLKLYSFTQNIIDLSSITVFLNCNSMHGLLYIRLQPDQFMSILWAVTSRDARVWIPSTCTPHVVGMMIKRTTMPLFLGRSLIDMSYFHLPVCLSFCIPLTVFSLFRKKNFKHTCSYWQLQYAVFVWLSLKTIRIVKLFEKLDTVHLQKCNFYASDFKMLHLLWQQFHKVTHPQSIF